MKAIELNKEQADKLTEMAHSLFPEYNNHSDGSNSIKVHQDNHDGYHSGVLMGYCTNNLGDEDDDGSRSISWYEFCIHHLGSKLGLYPARIFKDLEEEHYGIHIVDYLYEEFKKLK